MTSMAALAPLLGAGVLALMVGAFHGRLTPPSAARSLTAALLLVTIAALPSVWILSFGFLGHVPALGHLIRWCAPAAAIDGPIPPYVGAPAMALCVFGLVRVTQVMISYRRMRDVRRQPVEVTREDTPVAYTRPGPAGRIVVSTGLISMLTVRELDVVLAHERAHGAHRHDRMVFIARVSQAAVPVLRPLTDRLLFTLERWADEEAVTATGGDRRFVARTIARVAVQASAPAPALAVAELGVPARVDALLRPFAASSRSRLLVVSIWEVIVVAAFMASYQLHHLARLVVALCPN